MAHFFLKKNSHRSPLMDLPIFLFLCATSFSYKSKIQSHLFAILHSRRNSWMIERILWKSLDDSSNSLCGCHIRDHYTYIGIGALYLIHRDSQLCSHWDLIFDKYGFESGYKSSVKVNSRNNVLIVLSLSLHVLSF